MVGVMKDLILFIEDVVIREIPYEFGIRDISFYNYNPDAPLDEASIIGEVQRGRKFVNNRGEKVVLAASDKVQKTIGLMFGVFNVQQEIINGQRDRINEQGAEINIIRKMGFWQRLKYLFRGYN